MAYKVYARNSSAYEKKLKEARRERRKAKHNQPIPLPSLPTAEQVVERYAATLASLNARVRVVLEKDHPEALPLMGAGWVLTAKRFSEAGLADMLRKAMGECKEDIEELCWVFLLGSVTHSV